MTDHLTETEKQILLLLYRWTYDCDEELLRRVGTIIGQMKEVEGDLKRDALNNVDAFGTFLDIGVAISYQKKHSMHAIVLWQLVDNAGDPGGTLLYLKQADLIFECNHYGVRYGPESIAFPNCLALSDKGVRVARELQCKTTRKSGEPLTSKQQASLKIVKGHRGLTAPAICDLLAKENPPVDLDENTFRTHMFPALKPYGVINTRGLGYHIDPSYDQPDAGSSGSLPTS